MPYFSQTLNEAAEGKTIPLRLKYLIILIVSSFFSTSYSMVDSRDYIHHALVRFGRLDIQNRTGTMGSLKGECLGTPAWASHVER